MSRYEFVPVVMTPVLMTSDGLTPEEKTPLTVRSSTPVHSIVPAFVIVLPPSPETTELVRLVVASGQAFPVCKPSDERETPPTTSRDSPTLSFAGLVVFTKISQSAAAAFSIGAADIVRIRQMSAN